MLIYRNQETPELAASWLASLEADLSMRPYRIRDARDLVVDVGDFETALADAEYPAEDGCSELVSVLRGASVAVASSFVALLDEDPESARAARERAGRLLALLDDPRLPRLLRRRVPEGFSRYCLFPEQYHAAALRFAAERERGPVVVIGLRSIGTALSAVVHATLQRRGMEVESFTLRPRGHPFDRVLRSGRSMSDALVRRSEHARYVVVDEGPGMSGSSFASAATLLAELGVSPDAVALMPSWEPDASALLSRRARAAWSAHRRYVAPFDPSWIGLLSGRDAHEVSAGAWRGEPWAEGSRAAVVPQHERRKFVLRGAGHRPRIARFAGFGRYGAAVRARAEQLAHAGFGPSVVAFDDGFLELELVDGRPLRTSDGESGELVDRLARYARFVARSFQSNSNGDVEALLGMLRANATEALGEGCAPALAPFEERARSLPDTACVVDGHMAPHEWILGPQDIRKIDAFDHGDDHFFPGPTDVAWDLAGAVVEFDFTRRRRDELLERYAVVSGDRSITTRFTFYEVAYLAFRSGYVTLAATLAGRDDVKRFSELATAYRMRLHERLAAGPS